MGWSANLDLPPGDEAKALTLTGFQAHVDLFLECIYNLNYPLSVGKHLYKFIVEGSWIHDPTRPTETDPEGNVNNVVTVGEHGVVGEEEEEEEGEGEEDQRCQYATS